MKRIFFTVIVIHFLCQSCFAQDVSKTSEMKVGYQTHQDILNYLKDWNACIALNSIVEVNGIVLPRDTYGYISYINNGGENKKCVFLHLGGVIVVLKKDFEELLKLPDTTHVEIAICLQSPVEGWWGGYWDQVMVRGSFDAGRLAPTRSMYSPCFHFIITSIGKKYFKIQFDSWGVQTCYYSADSHPLTAQQRKRLDRKEKRIYKRAKLMHFYRDLW
ncbi:MAG: hypothetical protein II670_14785 [Alphaproteobacteria bacterium]|nr:hypothetical protein [Alphaproteobacteria bacterium]